MDEKKQLDTNKDDLVRMNRAKPEEKLALGIGALIFAGVSAGFLFLSTTGKSMRQMLKKPRK